MRKEFLYFGVWPGDYGHYLYGVDGRHIREFAELPCTVAPDGVFLSKPEVLYLPAIWRTAGWTVYAMWDRSADRRPGSNSVFFLPGEWNDVQCWDEISKQFPTISQRISNARMKTNRPKAIS